MFYKVNSGDSVKKGKLEKDRFSQISEQLARNCNSQEGDDEGNDQKKNENEKY